MLKKIFAVVASALLLLSCASAPSQTSQGSPSWLTNFQQEYPNSLYLTGVGIADNLSSARQQAKAEIAAQIQSTVQSEITDIQQEIEVEGEVTSSSDITQKIREITDVTISGVTYPMSDERDGQFYVLAVLDKLQYLQDVTTQLREHLNVMSELYQSIDARLEDGNLLNAYENYQTLTGQMEEFVSLRSLYNAVSSSPYPNAPARSLNTVWSNLQSISGTIDLEVTEGEGQSTRLGESLDAPVTARVTYQSSGQTVHARGIPVVFENSDDNTITRMETGMNGEASATVTAVPGQSPDEGVVTVVFGNVKYPGLRQILRGKSVNVPYGIIRSNYVFAIQVIPENRSYGVVSALQNGLSDLGYSIQPDAPVILRAQLTITNSREVSGFAGSQYLAEAQADVALVSSETNTILGQATFTGRGMSTQSTEQATTQAYNRIEISRDGLTRLISNADGELQKIFP